MKNNQLNQFNLYGVDTSHLVAFQETSLHQDVITDLNDFFKQANDVGIEPIIVSGHRSFERQKMIWNKKLTGKQENLEQHIGEVLRYSALPGLSRHHWGTDFDIADEVALKLNPNYQISLEQHEYTQGGIFEHLGRWLNQNLNTNSAFFRPYEKDLGGVAHEPWHLSHKVLATVCLDRFDQDQYLDFLKGQTDLIGFEYIIHHLDEILTRYFYQINRPQ
jgi:LAS superfamily LD-carboxypeptidase LdcB